MNPGKAAVAEFLGTFWLVFGGTGAAVLAASLGAGGIGLVGVSLAFGLTVVTMAYAVGHISGGHFNPAVAIGLWIGGRFPARRIAVYVAAQLFGAVAGSAVLFVIASGKAGFTLADGFRELWVFIIFPIVGGVIGGLVYRYVLDVPAAQRDKVEGPGEATD